MNIALAVLALLLPCYLSAPRQPRDTIISCSDGSHLPTSCPPAEPLADCLKGNRDLWLIMCDSRVVQQLAKGVCFNLSKVRKWTNMFCVACEQVSSTLSTLKCLPQLIPNIPNESMPSYLVNSASICLLAPHHWLPLLLPLPCPSTEQ